MLDVVPAGATTRPLTSRADPACPHRQLRRWDLRGIDEDDVALVLTELGANAVEHARTPVTVTVDLLSTTGNAANSGAGGPAVRIEVADGSTAPPRLRPPQ